jgi:single-stranded-DNA-specific exonuclease
MNKWIIGNNIKQKSKITDIDEFVKLILSSRGINTKEAIYQFLNPEISDINIDNAGIDKKELEKAKKRILKAIDDKESVVVYTDYDADGVCAGAIVWETLHKMGVCVMPYIPDRIKEGYGLSVKGIDFIREKYKPSLLITVDHGVSAYEQVRYAKVQGMETIILDHHVLPGKTPDAVALIHSTKMSSGGIALIFSNYLSDKGFEYLELAAISTIGDLIPLTGINRVIVKYGLESLNKTKRIGLLALIDKSGLKTGQIDIYGISHILVPRINAMGRLTHAIDALRLLCTKDNKRAEGLAEVMCQTNRNRQLLTEESLMHAKDLFVDSNKKDKKNGKNISKLIFISHSNYKEGVIGLIAGRLMEENYKPAIVVSVGEVYCKASARSITGLNIIEIIRKADDLLVDAGGHPMAAGFTFKKENLEKVKERLEKLVEENLCETQMIKKINIDLQIRLSDVSKELYRRIQALGPFGMGNPEPVFAVLGIKPVNMSAVGKDAQHIKFTVNEFQEEVLVDGSKVIRIGEVFKVIGFGFGHLSTEINKDTVIDMAFTIDRDTWNGNDKLQLKIKDVRI